MLVLKIFGMLAVLVAAVLAWVREHKPGWRQAGRIPSWLLILLVLVFLVQVGEAVWGYIEDENTNSLLKQSNDQVIGLKGEVKGLNAAVDKLIELVPESILKGSRISGAEIGRLREENSLAFATMGRSALARTLDGYEVELICDGTDPCKMASSVLGVLRKYNPGLSYKQISVGADMPDYAKRWRRHDLGIQSDSIIYRYIRDDTQVAAIASLVTEAFPKLCFKYLPTTSELPAEKTIYIVIRSSDLLRQRPTPVPIP